jgi:hypothetical protein
MKTSYSLLTLLSISLVTAGPLPIRNAALVRRTEHLGETPAPAPTHPAPAAAPAPAHPAPAAAPPAEDKAGKFNRPV